MSCSFKTLAKLSYVDVQDKLGEVVELSVAIYFLFRSAFSKQGTAGENVTQTA